MGRIPVFVMESARTLVIGRSKPSSPAYFIDSILLTCLKLPRNNQFGIEKIITLDIVSAVFDTDPEYGNHYKIVRIAVRNTISGIYFAIVYLDVYIAEIRSPQLVCPYLY